MILGNGMWHLIRQSDTMSIIVLVILFIMSVICWTVFILEIVLLRVRRRDLRRVLNEFKRVQSPEEILSIATKYAHTLPGSFLSENLLFLKTLLETRSLDTEKNAQQLDYFIDQTLERTLIEQEAYLPVFSTSAAVAPLLGLFGTVWGLIQSFLSISEKQAADIVVVAPGIAQALITTLAGLMVAIPALAMFNYLPTQIRVIEEQLISLADRVRYVMQRLIK